MSSDTQLHNLLVKDSLCRKLEKTFSDLRGALSSLSLCCIKLKIVYIIYHVIQLLVILSTRTKFSEGFVEKEKSFSDLTVCRVCIYVVWDESTPTLNQQSSSTTLFFFLCPTIVKDILFFLFRQRKLQKLSYTA